MAEGEFRKVRNLDMPPTYTSLGLKPSNFAIGQNTNDTKGFSTVLNGPGDILWLFKGSDYFTFNLRTRQIESGPLPLASWTMRSVQPLPLPFQNGIDAAVWGGEAFPQHYYLFKGSEYVRLNASHVPNERQRRGEPIEYYLACELHSPISGHWGLDGDDQSALLSSPSAAVHGIRQHSGKIHLFGPGAIFGLNNLQCGYLRYNEDPQSEYADKGPCNITAAFALPPLPSAIDHVFYGTGADEERLFFVLGAHCWIYDTPTDMFLRVESLEKLFPAIAVHMPRPQLFLVENYTLEVFRGPPRQDELIHSIITPARSKKKMVLITEIVTAAQTAVRQNLMQSVDQTTTTDFYQQLDNREDASEETDSYRYRMQALFHGEAAAKGVWGGEVDANLNVDGGTDEARKKFATAAFQTMSSQVRKSTHQVSYVALTEESAQSFQGRIFRQEVEEFNNLASDTTKETQIYSVIEPYVALLTLKSVQVAFTDGMREPEIFALATLPWRLRELLTAGSEEFAQHLVGYIRRELSSIPDVEGGIKSILRSEDPADLRIDTQLEATYRIDLAPDQTLVTKGVVVGAKEDLLPTYAMTSSDRHLES